MRHDEALQAMHRQMAAMDAARAALPPVLRSLPERLVNIAGWAGHAVALGTDLPEGAMLVVVNATRPLNGLRRWTGSYIAGLFFAEGLYEPGGVDPADLYGWRHDDARRLVFITNAQIRVLVYGKLAEHGYATPEDVHQTGPELAAGLELPWNDGEPWDEVPR
jgi:hypothetical protein